MTVSKIRANLVRSFDQVVEERAELVVTRKAGDVVLVARDEYDSLIETLRLLRCPASAAALQRVGAYDPGCRDRRARAAPR